MTRGRPHKTPDGSVPAVNNMAAWLKGLLKEEPCITYQDVADHINAMRGPEGSRMAKSTVGRHLNGHKTPEPDLIDAILALRVLDESHRRQELALTRDAHDLLVAAKAGEHDEAVRVRRQRVAAVSTPPPPAAAPAARRLGSTSGNPPRTGLDPQQVQRARENDRRHLRDAEERAGTAQEEAERSMQRAAAAETSLAAETQTVRELQDQVVRLTEENADYHQEIRRLADNASQITLERVQLQARVDELIEGLNRALADDQPSDPVGHAEVLLLQAQVAALQKLIHDRQEEAKQINQSAEFDRREARTDRAAARDLRSRAAIEAQRTRAGAQAEAAKYERYRDALVNEIGELAQRRQALDTELASLQEMVHIVTASLTEIVPPPPADPSDVRENTPDRAEQLTNFGLARTLEHWPDYKYDPYELLDYVPEPGEPSLPSGSRSDTTFATGTPQYDPSTDPERGYTPSSPYTVIPREWITTALPADAVAAALTAQNRQELTQKLRTDPGVDIEGAPRLGRQASSHYPQAARHRK